jgi:hypothetical protein
VFLKANLAMKTSMVSLSNQRFGRKSHPSTGSGCLLTSQEPFKKQSLIDKKVSAYASPSTVMIFKARLLIVQRALSAVVASCLFLPALRASSSGRPVKSTGLSDSTLMSLSATTIVAISHLSYRVTVQPNLSLRARALCGRSNLPHDALGELQPKVKEIASAKNASQ